MKSKIQSAKKRRGPAAASRKKSSPIIIKTSPVVKTVSSTFGYPKQTDKESGVDYLISVKSPKAGDPPTWIAVGPGMFGYRLSKIMELWEFYRFESIELSYEPAVGATTNGRITVWYDPDPVDATSDASVYLTHANASTNVFAPLKFKINASQLNSEFKWFITSPDQSHYAGDWRMGFQGQIGISVEGTDAADLLVGRIRASWTCAFKTPAVQSPIVTTPDFGSRPKTFTITGAKQMDKITGFATKLAKQAAMSIVVDTTTSVLSGVSPTVASAARSALLTMSGGAVSVGVDVVEAANIACLVWSPSLHVWWWALPWLGGVLKTYTTGPLYIDGFAYAPRQTDMANRIPVVPISIASPGSYLFSLDHYVLNGLSIVGIGTYPADTLYAFFALAENGTGTYTYDALIVPIDLRGMVSLPSGVEDHDPPEPGGAVTEVTRVVPSGPGRCVLPEVLVTRTSGVAKTH